MKLNKGIPIKMGQLHGMVFGGRFREYEPGTRRLVGIKMAEEIDHPHDFSVDTEDFSVPDEAQMQRGVTFALGQLAEGNDVYVGCMGGIGRTGLFMGCIAKVMQDFEEKTGDHPGICIGVDPATYDPVLFVRRHYIRHAIETDEQQAFVRGFDTAPVLEAYSLLMLSRQGPLPEPVREVEVQVKTVYLSPYDFFIDKMVRPFFPGLRKP